jgi:RNA polymerase sigma factor (TIGR02999 family)
MDESVPTSRAGGKFKPEDLLPLVYDELRRLAARQIGQEKPGQTLQPTALVHEAWIKVSSGPRTLFYGRRHFFAAAAEAMRHILIDRARRKQANRHGGQLERVEFDELNLPSPEKASELLDINEVLDQLAQERPLEAELVKLRYFVGMTNEQAAEVLEISPRTAKYYWAHARAWLFRRITDSRSPG